MYDHVDANDVSKDAVMIIHSALGKRSQKLADNFVKAKGVIYVPDRIKMIFKPEDIKITATTKALFLLDDGPHVPRSILYYTMSSKTLVVMHIESLRRSQCKGYASKLLEDLKELMTMKKFRQIVTHIHYSNANAIRLFEKAGFIKKGYENTAGYALYTYEAKR